MDGEIALSLVFCPPPSWGQLERLLKKDGVRSLQQKFLLILSMSKYPETMEFKSPKYAGELCC